jgi:pyruvate,orthophosphate dikinase
MIPLVGASKEYELQEKIVRETAERVFAARKRRVNYLVGTMIEVPRGALLASEIARRAEFFSFGTNDLTQTTFGLSRDDVPKVLASYLESEIYAVDPFVSIDEAGVGRLMKIATEEGRLTRPDLKVGICGEHGGDPASVAICHRLNLNYVSCSPFRIPIARLAAARAVLSESAASVKNLTNVNSPDVRKTLQPAKATKTMKTKKKAKAKKSTARKSTKRAKRTKARRKPASKRK